MQLRSLRGIVLWTLGPAALASLVAGAVFKDRALEEWYIRKLRSPDERTRDRAAETLGQMRSERAVPYLLEGVVEGRGEKGEILVTLKPGIVKALQSIRPQDLPGALPSGGIVVDDTIADWIRKGNWEILRRIVVQDINRSCSYRMPVYSPVTCTVTAVDSKRGRIFLNAGSDHKVEVGYELTVYRDGEFIGKVEVITVWPDLSSTEVLFIKEGAEVRAGDSATTQI